MKLITEVVDSGVSFSIRRSNHAFIDNFPIISTLENEEVIKNFIPIMKEDGHNTPEAVLEAPTNLYRDPRKRKAPTLIVQQPVTKPTKKKRLKTIDEEIEEMVEYVTLEPPQKRRKFLW